MTLDVERRRSVPQVRAAISLLAVLVAIAPALAGAASGPSAGVSLRRARQALAEANTQAATDALQAARAAEPRTSRGLEAALLLADLQLKTGNAAGADHTLGDAERDFPDGETGARLLLARGWLGLARGESTSALRHFERVSSRTDDVASRELALLGTAWARLTTAGGTPDVPAELVALASSAQDPTVRVGALLSLSRAHAARGEHRRALRALRRLQRLARGTTLADDVALAIGLAQLDMGRPRAARDTLGGLVSDQAGAVSAPAETTPRLTLADLRLPPGAFAARLATLYAHETQPGIDLHHFLGALFDRPVRNDAATALGLADAALAARKDA